MLEENYAIITLKFSAKEEFMKKYIYITSPSRIRSFLNKIQSVGVPDKLTLKGLEMLGFKSKNDRPLLRIMKAIDFVSADGVPTDKWKNYRDKKKAKYVLAEGIRKHYAELFKTYPNAHLQDNRTLRDFFRAKTDIGDRAISLIVTTFNALRELADFEIEKPPKEKPAIPEERIEKIEREIPREEAPSIPPLPSIHIDLQIHLSPEAKPEQIDKIFESMAKHLKDFYRPQKAK